MNLRFFAVVALLSILLSLFSCNRGMREIQRLELNGYIIPTPNREIKSAVAKSRSESGGSVGGTCRTVLATTWAIALGEPSPFGEIVASVITVAVAGVLMYEVLLCPAGSSNGGSSTDDRWNYCQFKFSSTGRVWYLFAILYATGILASSLITCML